MCWALFSLVATDILGICFTSFNRLCGLQLTNLATQNHWKHEPLQHSPWPWCAFSTHPATLGKHAMYCLAACCCSVMNWPRHVGFPGLLSSLRLYFIPIFILNNSNSKNQEHPLTFGFWIQCERVQSAFIHGSNDSAVIGSMSDWLRWKNDTGHATFCFFFCAMLWCGLKLILRKCFSGRLCSSSSWTTPFS